MTNTPKRTAELRLIVVVWVDLADETLADALAALSPRPHSVADVIAAEIVSNLESVPYVTNALASQL